MAQIGRISTDLQAVWNELCESLSSAPSVVKIPVFFRAQRYLLPVATGLQDVPDGENQISAIQCGRCAKSRDTCEQCVMQGFGIDGRGP